MTLEQENEIVRCAKEPVYFVDTYYRVNSDVGPLVTKVDTAKVELIQKLDAQERVVGRYPRRYGKTVTLSAYALHQALFHKKHTMYFTGDFKRRMWFLQTTAYAAHHLPAWMRPTIKETPEYLQVNDGHISVHAIDRNSFHGWRGDVLLVDEPIGMRGDLPIGEFVNFAKLNKARLAIVGTFKPSTPVIGPLWDDARRDGSDWCSLPSRDEDHKLSILLSMADEVYRRDY